jgi:hypothetical protein
MNNEPESRPSPAESGESAGAAKTAKVTAAVPGPGRVVPDKAVPNKAVPNKVATELSAQGAAPLLKRSRRQKRRRTKYVLRALLGVFLLLIGYVAVTMYPYITGPGTDPLNARVAEWARDHGLSRVVTWLENENYTAPPTGGKLSPSQLALLKSKSQGGPQKQGQASTTGANGETAAKAPAGPPPDLPTNITPLAAGQVPGEGVWQPAVMSASGVPIVETAALRPDREHTSALAYVAWLNQKALSFSLHPGYQQPGGSWSTPDELTQDQRPGLVATWNGGFKVRPDDALGGFYAEGQTAVSLVSGRAAEVFYTDGSMKVGLWGRDESMQSNVAAVRENLNLLVDNGQVTVGQYDGSGAQWGYTIMGWYYIARSGVGMTANGDIVYVSGSELSVYTLAQLLKAAGATYGMELDINPSWVSFMTYNGIADPADPTPTKLWDFAQPANRYFEPSDRDFVAVHAR